MARIFRANTGHMVAIGFDPIKRVLNPRCIHWSDLKGNWEVAHDNEAGWNEFTFDVEPQFVHQDEITILAYQPGLCIEMRYVGLPMVWDFKLLRAEAT